MANDNVPVDDSLFAHLRPVFTPIAAIAVEGITVVGDVFFPFALWERENKL